MTTPTLQIDDLPTAQLSLGLPEDETFVLLAPAALDLLHAALAYLGRIGREPAPQPRWTAGDRRYLGGPLIVGDPQGAWGGDTPAWLRDAVRIARLGLVLAGEHDHASEEEAVAYLTPALATASQRKVQVWPPAWPRRCTPTGPRSTSGLRRASWRAGTRSPARRTSGT